VSLRLAVVDDSAFVRKAITRMFVGDERVEVIGSAGSGEELLANLETWQPDVITLDLSMPGIGGLLTLDRVMAIRPTPVVILSTHAGRGAPQTIEALHRGAADFIDKQQYSLLDFQSLKSALVGKILAVTEGGRKADRQPAKRSVCPEPEHREFELVLIGASTGGPPAIEQVLTDLGHRFPVPTLVVQHMPVGFTRAFADRLNVHLPLRVNEARANTELEPGVVYIAPGGQHLRLDCRGEKLFTELSLVPKDVSHRPSVDELFSSVVESLAHRVVAVLLTGMGKDGADAMLRLRRRGAFTIAQDELTSIVWGMPGAAVAVEAAQEVMSLSEIGGRVRDLVATSR